MLGWGLIAVAPFARGRVQHKRFVLGNALAVCVGALIVIWGMTRSLGIGLPSFRSGASTRRCRCSLTGALAAAALLHLLSVIGFSNRFRLKGEDLDYWLALGAT